MFIDYILGFGLLLGVLIFIHEFGHFIVAKACGVRVETFSIGMGKKFLRFTKGETEYALSLLPLGGYVKMLGQDPREEVPAGLEPRSFRAKALWQRAAIVMAGPFFNFALAVLVFIGLYHHGVPTQAAILARVLPESPAAAAGFRSGDRVTAIDDPEEGVTRIREMSDIEKAVGAASGRPLMFHLDRAGQAVDVRFTPVMGPDRDSSIGVITDRGTLPGVEYREAGPIIQVVAGSWAATRQLPSTIWVEELTYAVGGVEQTEKIGTFPDLQRAWAKAAAAQTGAESGKVVIKASRISMNPAQDKGLEDPVTFPLAWTLAREAMPAQLDRAGVVSSEMMLTEVKADSPADKLGLKAGDRIVKLNSKNVYSFQSFRAELQKLAVSGQAIQLGWYRDAKYLESSVKPELVSARDPLTEAKKKQFQIGAMFLPNQALPTETVLKGDNLIDTVQLGFDRTLRLSKSMLASFYHLAKGDISPKTLGGPILIGKIAGESLKEGAVPFLRMMAFISLNLCILNLLPVPVLDGGHLVLYCVEALRRKPLSVKTVEMWTTAGFFFLMSLIAVVFFNDLSRLGLFKIFKL